MDSVLPILTVLKDNETREGFAKYCSNLCCSEAVMFWEAIQDFKRIQNAVILNTRARGIYEKFIRPEAAFSVKIEQEEIKIIEELLERNEIKSSMFNSIESTVLLLMDPLVPGYFLSIGKQINLEGDIQVVGNWNHSSLPSSSNLAKKMEKELVRLDFQKVHVGMDTIKIEEENKRLDNWCNLLEQDSVTNKVHIERMEQTLEKLKNETEYLKKREVILQKSIQNARATLLALGNDSAF